MVQLPFLAFFAVYAQAVSDNINIQLANGHSEALSVFCNSIQDQFTAADEFLNLSFYNGEVYKKVMQCQNINDAQGLMSEQEDMTKLFIENYYFISAIAFKLADFDKTYFYAREKSLFSDEQLTMYRQIGNDSFFDDRDGWILKREYDSPVMVREISMGDISCVIMIDVGYITKSSQLRNKMSSPVIFFKSGERITDASWVRNYEKNGGALTDDDDYDIIKTDTNSYMVVNQSVISMTAYYAVPYVYDWSWLYYALYALLMLMLVSFAVAGIYLYISFFKPLKKLIIVMKQIKDGDIEARAENYGNREFDEINNIFNSMLDTIKTLKIEAYENKLNLKYSQLNALRLQIRRHFFLNCLKIVYAMAESGDVSEIQKIVLLLSEYLRYTLDITENLVPIKLELNMCENYIRLQEASNCFKFKLEITVDASLIDFKIPPVSLLTLVENSCKYGVSENSMLIVKVRATYCRIENESFITLSVSDNGKGFSDELLKLLNTQEGLERLKREKHVGIVNVIDRFKMFFGQDCYAMFTNSNGAKAELIIPMKGEYLE